MRHLLILTVLAFFPGAFPGTAKAADPQIKVVNMIPATVSGETNQDSEPNLAVNPRDPKNIAGSAFTRGTDICRRELAPIFVSTDEGATWAMNCIVPSDASGMTSDITVRFAAESDNLYAGILRRPGFLRLNILRTDNFTGASAMTVLEDRDSVDQPYVQATTVGGKDQVFVGDNDFNAPGGMTATVDESLDAGMPAPVFTSVRIEARATSGQDGPPIRPAIHPDGTIYAAFYGWRAFTGSVATTDLVVVRDDNGGTGPTPFTDLTDPGDGLVGQRVVQNRSVPWANFSQGNFCQERFVGSNISIATDPNNSDIVYVAWADRLGDNDYTLHVRRSDDRGATWSNDLRTVSNATNPALAINKHGLLGFLYQQCVSEGDSPRKARWVTHIELTEDSFTTLKDLVLADVPADAPQPQFIPYIGDYVHLMTVGANFYGIFSANNTPNMANFPNGVVYQRNADFSTQTLLDNNKEKVDPSIDPFFFKVTPPEKKVLVYKYAAKLICGVQEDPKNTQLARGLYATAINIHNPNAETVKFRKSLSLTFPPSRQRPGKVIRIADDKLKEDQALEVDCVDVRQRLFPGGFPRSYIKGFVTITSSHSLDVTAVYSTRALDQEVCCERTRGDDGKDCCGRDGRDPCGDKNPEPCCHDRKPRCSSCCFTIAGGHSSVDVEQITERVMEREPPGDEEEPNLPDLVPVAPFLPPPPKDPLHLPQNFCMVSDDGSVLADAVRVIVRNQGSGAAAASVTSVQFINPSSGPVATVTQDTGPLDANGGETSLDFAIPNGCYSSGGAGCSFDITVNAGEPTIEETNEGNNTASSGCLGVAP
jgi:hypothetical protein